MINPKVTETEHFEPSGKIYSPAIEPFKNVTAASIAREPGVSKSTFSRPLAGKSDITPEVAVRLSAVLGRTAESWLLMQDNYDLWKAREAVDTEELHRFDFTQVA